MRKIGLAVVCLVSLLVGSEKPYEISLTVGGTKAESDLLLKNHSNYGVRFGLENSYLFEKIFDTVEFIYERSNGVDYQDSSLQTDINRYSINFLHQYKNFDQVIPYGLVGVGYEDFNNEYLKAKDSITTNLGVGVKYYLTDSLSLRAEVRDQVNLEHSVQHEMIYTIGVGYRFGTGNFKEREKEKVQEPQNRKEAVEEEQKVSSNNEQQTATSVAVLVDSDNDGVADVNDNCPKTLQGCRVDVQGCAIDYTFDVNFDLDQYDIKDKYIEKLKNFVEYMNRMSGYKAVINGHTDFTGTKSYNMNLSIKRAKAVMDKLIELGIKKERLSFKGYGEEDPIASNETVEGRAKNRRVEAQIIK